VLVAAAVIGVSIGKIATAPAAEASAAHRYTLRVGDKGDDSRRLKQRCAEGHSRTLAHAADPNRWRIPRLMP